MKGNVTRARRAALEIVIRDLQRVAAHCALAGARDEAEQLHRIVSRLRPFVDLASEAQEISPLWI